MNSLRLYVWETFDGMMFVPWARISWPGHPHGGMPGPMYRVLVGHDVPRGWPQDVVNRKYHAPEFNDIQIRALVDLVMYKQGAHKDYDRVVFHSGNDWRDRGCPDRRRGKILKRVDL